MSKHHKLKDFLESVNPKNAVETVRNAANDANIALKKAEQLAKDAEIKGGAIAKGLAQSALNDAKKKYDKFKELNKKLFKTLENFSGKIRGAYKKLLRKALLDMEYNTIKSNVHGVATRLYPAIGDVATLKKQRFSPKYVPLSKNVYNELLITWTELGGSKTKLDEAIRSGASKRIFKFKTNPYEAPAATVIEKGSAAMITKRSGIDGEWSNLDGDTNTDESSQFDTGADATANTPATTVTASDQSDLSNAGATSVPAPEKHAHWHAFQAWIHNLFHKHKADTTPYATDDQEAAQEAFNNQAIADAQNAPATTTTPADAQNAPTSNAANFASDTSNDQSNINSLYSTSVSDATGILNDINPKVPDPKEKGASKVNLPAKPKSNTTSHTAEIITSLIMAGIGAAIGFFAFPSKRKFAIPIGILGGAGIGYGVGSLIGKGSSKTVKGESPAHVDAPVDPSKIKI